jgi:hypothetical protein
VSEHNQKCLPRLASTMVRCAWRHLYPTRHVTTLRLTCRPLGCALPPGQPLQLLRCEGVNCLGSCLADVALQHGSAEQQSVSAVRYLP